MSHATGVEILPDHMKTVCLGLPLVIKQKCIYIKWCHIALTVIGCNQIHLSWMANDTLCLVCQACYMHGQSSHRYMIELS